MLRRCRKFTHGCVHARSASSTRIGHKRSGPSREWGTGPVVGPNSGPLDRGCWCRRPSQGLRIPEDPGAGLAAAGGVCRRLAVAGRRTAGWRAAAIAALRHRAGTVNGGGVAFATPVAPPGPRASMAARLRPRRVALLGGRALVMTPLGQGDVGGVETVALQEEHSLSDGGADAVGRFRTRPQRNARERVVDRVVLS